MVRTINLAVVARKLSQCVVMLRQILLGVLACIVAAQAVSYPDLFSKVQANQNFDDELMGIYRLPNDTVPEHYSVRLVTNVHRNDFSFTGEVDITFNVVQATSVITLHHRQLVIGSVTLNNAITPAVNIPLAPIAYDVTTNFLSVPLASSATPLAVGSKYILHIAFTGSLRTDQSGFYRISYADDDGRSRFVNFHVYVDCLNDIDDRYVCLPFTDGWPQHSLLQPMLVMVSRATMSLHCEQLLI